MHQQKELEAIEKKHPKEYALFKEWFDQNHQKGLKMVTSQKLREEITTRRAEEFFNRIRPELGQKLSTFWEWDQDHNADRSDPVEWFNTNPQGIFEELDRRYRTGQ